MNTPKQLALEKWSEKIIPQHFHEHLLAYCPTMGLIAIVSLEENVDVYRIANGQHAFGLKRSPPRKSVDAICWKYNGQYLAIAWNNGSVDVLSTDTGKIIHRETQTAATSKSKDSKIDTPKDGVTYLDWSLNFIDVVRVKASVNDTSSKNGKRAKFSTTEFWDTQGDKIKLDDLLGRQPDIAGLGVASDLPEQLALTDVEALLPKLSVIPTAPASNPRMRMMAMAKSEDETPEVFSSQASIDTLFHSHHLRDHNAVDILLSCHRDKTVSATIYDSLEIGQVKIPDDWGMGDCSILCCASHPYTTSHSLLIEYSERSASDTNTASKTRIAYAPLNIRFIQSAGMYLPTIVSKTTQLQNLLKYLQQTIKFGVALWHQAQDLPSRFIRNVGDSLAEKSEPSFVENLYHLAMTGNCLPTIKEWLIDELAESGHKRWDHSMGQGYTRILELVHENLCPALDRTTVVLTTLRGLASYHDGSNIFNVPVEDFTRAMDLVRCLRYLAHLILTAAAEERRQFSVFSRWLRYEIDIQSTSATSSSAEEMESSEAGVDYAHLLVYIQGGLTNSRLEPFFEARKPNDQDVEADRASVPTLEEIMKVVESKRPQAESSKKEILSISSAFARLSQKCESLFSKIAAWQVSSSGMEAAYLLEEERMSSARDVRMVYRDLTDEWMSTFIALVPTYSKNEVRLHHISQQLNNRQSPVQSIDSALLKLPNRSTVRDVKFADDESLLILLHAEDQFHLLQIPLSQISTFQTPPTPSHFTSLPSPSLTSKTNKPPTQNLQPLLLPNPQASSSSLSHKRSSSKNPDHNNGLSLPAKEDIQQYTIHSFAPGASFAPSRLVVNTRRERKSVVVVAEEGRSWTVFGLGGSGGIGERGGDDEED